MSNDTFSISNIETRSVAKHFRGGIFSFDNSLFEITNFLNEQLGSYEEVEKTVEEKIQPIQESEKPKEATLQTTELLNPQENTELTPSLKALLEIHEKLSTEKKSFPKFIVFDIKKLEKEDTIQINKLIQNPDFMINIPQINVYNNFQNTYNKSDFTYKNMIFSQNLQETLYKAFKNQQPVRIDFDNDSSVILKVDKEGKLSAEFLSSDKAMELILKDNINNLKTKLDKEGLPYKDISYKNHQDDNKERKRED